MNQQVKKWVEEQGYSLEMRVARAFREHGFLVSQFEHFVDQESQSVRPVDVVASLSKNIGDSQITIKLFIECKYSGKDKPWVIVVTSDRFDKFSFFSRILKSGHPANWKSFKSFQGRVTAAIVHAVDVANQLNLFQVTNPGYVVAETLTNQKDHAYEAIIQISKSVEAHDTEVEIDYGKIVHEHDYGEVAPEKYDAQISGIFCSIAFPIVVINGHLFESSLEGVMNFYKR